MKPLYDKPLPDGWREKPLKNVSIRKRGYSWDKEQETEVLEDGAIPVSCDGRREWNNTSAAPSLSLRL